MKFYQYYKKIYHIQDDYNNKSEKYRFNNYINLKRRRYNRSRNYNHNRLNKDYDKDNKRQRSNRKLNRKNRRDKKFFRIKRDAYLAFYNLNKNYKLELKFNSNKE